MGVNGFGSVDVCKEHNISKLEGNIMWHDTQDREWRSTSIPMSRRTTVRIRWIQRPWPLRGSTKGRQRQAALGIANATKENAMKETLSTELAAGP